MENLEKLVPDRRLSIDGQLAPPEVAGRISRIVVEAAEDFFNQCTVLLTDPDQKIINGDVLGPGTALVVELGYVGKLKAVFEGEVVQVEPRFVRDKPPSVLVRAFERLHRLALAPKTRSYLNADPRAVVTKIAHAHGLAAEAPAGSKDHILQPNITDLALLKKIAARTGNHLYLDRRKLVIGPPPRMGELDYTPIDGLKRVKVRLRATDQVPKVVVHGWDGAQKRAITGQAQPTGEGAEGATAARPFDRGDLHIEGVALVDMQEAEAVAKSTVERIAQRYVEARGEIVGNPGALPGAVLNLDKLGELLDGKYRITEARHEFDKRGYRVVFTATRVAAKKPAAKFVAPPGPIDKLKKLLGIKDKKTGTEGTEAKGTESTGAETKADSTGTDAKGTEAKGTETTGTESKGAEGTGTETTGTETKGTETKGAEGKGGETGDGGTTQKNVVPDSKGGTETGTGLEDLVDTGTGEPEKTEPEKKDPEKENGEQKEPEKAKGEIKTVQLVKKPNASGSAYCGDWLHAMVTGADLEDGAQVTGALSTGGRKLADFEAGAVQGNRSELKFEVKDVHKLLTEGVEYKPNAVLDAEVACGEAKGASTQGKLLSRPADFEFQGWENRPSHKVDGGFADLVPKYVGSVKGRELTIKVRVKYRPGWRRWMYDTGSGWMPADRRGAKNEFHYWDGKDWKKAENVDDNNLWEVVFSGANRRCDNWSTNWPDKSEMKDYEISADEINRTIAEVRKAWDNKFDVKRKGCKGAKDCCRWRLRVDIEMKTDHSSPDYTIDIIGREGGAGRSNVLAWYLYEEYVDGSGKITTSKVRKNVHAHEAGHMMGAYDEYIGGGTGQGKLRIIDDNSIMGIYLDPAKKHHMIDAATFLQQKLKKNHSLDWELVMKDAGEE